MKRICSGHNFLLPNTIKRAISYIKVKEKLPSCRQKKFMLPILELSKSDISEFSSFQRKIVAKPVSFMHPILSYILVDLNASNKTPT